MADVVDFKTRNVQIVQDIKPEIIDETEEHSEPDVDFASLESLEKLLERVRSGEVHGVTWVVSTLETDGSFRLEADVNLPGLYEPCFEAMFYASACDMLKQNLQDIANGDS